MSAFRYRASATDGVVREGVIHAPTRDGALADLRARALFPVSVEETAEDATRGGGWVFGRGATARVQLTRSLATLLEAGFPVDRALLVSAELTTHPHLRGVVQAIRQDVRAGRSLSEAFGAHPGVFPAFYVAMVAAGEAGRALGATFGRLADMQEEAAALRGQVASALIYPALMLSVGGFAVALLVFLVVPRFAGMLESAGAELPWTTRVLLGSTRLAVRWGWLALLIMGAAVAAAVRQSRSVSGRARRDLLLLRLPVIGGLLTRLATARVTRTLGTLLQNGVPLLNALEIARGTAGNEVIRRGIGEAIRKVREGATLTTALAPVLPQMAVQMIGVGEESSTLPDMLARVAATYDRETQATLKRAVTLVEPALILVLGAVVGFVALGMLQAIYSINAGSF